MMASYITTGLTRLGLLPETKNTGIEVTAAASLTGVAQRATTQTATPHRKPSPNVSFMSVALAALMASIGALLPIQASAQVLNNPPQAPITLIAFPQRDFIHADGYADDDQVIVRLIHDPALYPGATGGTTDPANPIAAQAGIVEVNHPGGACWLGQTPDIRPGDRVQVQVVSGTNAGRTDETTVANVTVQRPVKASGAGNVAVHGTAQDSTGAPLPVGEVEQRLLAPGNLFVLNNRRTLRATAAAGAEGTLAYDPIGPDNPNGINWTATYNLNSTDETLALGSESRALWLGRAIAPALETTAYEIGALTFAGPQAPCSAPLELLPPPPGSELIPPSAPSNLTLSIDNANWVTLNWDTATDNIGVTAYGIYRGGDASPANLQPIFTVSNPDGSAPAPLTFIDRNTPPGTYFYQIRALDAVGNRSDGSNVAGPIEAVQQVDVNGFALCSAAQTTLCINDPPANNISIIVFPSRDFISPSGFLADDKVTVQVLRKNPAGTYTIVSTAEGITPIDGFAEVNHPGGACWEGVTPDVRVGDIVRTIAYNPASVGGGSNPAGIRSIDQTTVAGVTTFRPIIVTPASASGKNGVVEVHGTALGANGLPLPIAEIEQRMIAKKDAFDFNARRAARASAAAGSDGILFYDTVNNPMGIKWTARYSGLDADDVARLAGGRSVSTNTLFLGADTRIHWLGRNPALLNESTIYENADGNPPGPAAPACSRPLETADETPPTSPGALTATALDQSVTLRWAAQSTDNWSVAGYRIYMDGAAIANTGPLATSYLIGSVTPGAHTYGVAAFDTASALGIGANIVDRITSGLGNLYGNLSAQSVKQLTSADTAPPTVPVNLRAQAGPSSVNLTWSGSTDNVGVAGYGVYRNGTLIAIATTTSYADTGLAGGVYTYAVDAADAAGNRSAKTATVSALVAEVPLVTVAPGSIAFGTINGGASATQSVTVRNTNAAGGDPLTISALAVSGAAAADYTVTAQTCTAAALVANGGSCSITVQFTPAALGARAAVLTLSHNAAGAARVTSTNILLSGTGSGAALSFTSNPVVFGTVTRNTTKDQTVTVKNGGTAAVAGNLGVAVAGVGYSIQSNTCPANLAANKTCSIVVRFIAPNVVSAFNGALSVSAPNALPLTATTTLTANTK
jgi:hypothetical protein